MKKIAVLHHNDADGFGAAFAAWYGLYVCCPPDVERPEMKFIPVQYGQEPPFKELKEFGADEVKIVDFSYKAPVLALLGNEFKSVFVADHHKTSAQELHDWYHEFDGVGHFIHDESKSGAVLAWEHFVPQFPIPNILLYVQDRDLWKFELEKSKEVNAYIATLPWDFGIWTTFDLETAFVSGEGILAFQAKQVEERLKGVKFITIGEHSVPCVNASENISELGEAMCHAYPEAPFSVSYCDRPDGMRSYSLRSRNGFDVSAVAKAWGGGGHQGSAGFTLPAPPRI